MFTKRYCFKCRKVYTIKGGVKFDVCPNCSDDYDVFRGLFKVKIICEDCGTIRDTVQVAYTNRLYYPVLCYDHRQSDSLCKLNKYSFDIKKYNSLLNRRVIFNENGDFVIEEIKDKKERDELDKQFMENFGNTDGGELCKDLEEEYIKQLEERREKISKDIEMENLLNSYEDEDEEEE